MLEAVETVEAVLGVLVFDEPNLPYDLPVHLYDFGAVVAQQVVAQPVIQPVVAQQVVAQPVIQPVVAQQVVAQPVIQPVVPVVAQPVIQPVVARL